MPRSESNIHSDRFGSVNVCDFIIDEIEQSSVVPLSE